MRSIVLIGLAVVGGVAVGTLTDSATVAVFVGLLTYGALLGLVAAASAEGWWRGSVMTVGALAGGIGVFLTARAGWGESWLTTALTLVAAGVLHQAIGAVVAPRTAARVVESLHGHDVVPH
jgi:hypothetical protein